MRSPKQMSNAELEAWQNSLYANDYARKVSNAGYPDILNKIAMLTPSQFNRVFNDIGAEMQRRYEAAAFESAEVVEAEADRTLLNDGDANRALFNKSAARLLNLIKLDAPEIIIEQATERLYKRRPKVAST